MKNTSITNGTAHPFAHSKNKIEILPNGIDIAEESALYDQFNNTEGEGAQAQRRSSFQRACSPPIAPSVFSRESIWLGDSIGESQTFARDVKIQGWTDVGDKDALGSYIAYDCAITTKEGTVIHVHKRYNAFCQLESMLRRTIPKHQHNFIPSLPPKSALARYRPAFLNRRRTLLQHWLSAVLLHPEIGASKPVRAWVME